MRIDDTNALPVAAVREAYMYDLVSPFFVRSPPTVIAAIPVDRVLCLLKEHI